MLEFLVIEFHVKSLRNPFSLVSMVVVTGLVALWIGQHYVTIKRDTGRDSLSSIGGLGGLLISLNIGQFLKNRALR